MTSENFGNKPNLIRSFIHAEQKQAPNLEYKLQKSYLHLITVKGPWHDNEF